ncbi:MAG: Tol-Pal system beta propeller repeat protein TolB [Holosporales bacterium]|jgi:TolB protein|nr:Tol-Pal system beta propeller repeat protein TolB [Holosporales bacterium]
MMDSRCPLVFLVGLIGTLISTIPPEVAAEIVIDINRGVIMPTKIAIPIFHGDSPLAQDITHVVTHDLESSGLFSSVDSRAHIQHLASFSDNPRFEDWRLIHTQVLVHAEVVPSGDKIDVSFKVYDVVSQQTLDRFSLSGRASAWRQMAHMIADIIYSRITGEKPYFNSRIVYISESYKKKRLIKRLALMDLDGANHKFLTKGETLVTTPRFSPTQQEIVYFSYVEAVNARGRRYTKGGRLYIFNLQTGETKAIGDAHGISFAPRYSPDGKSLIFSVARKGVSSIYTFDLQTRKTRRLTNSNCIDTSPCYSPDGRQIVFNSDRGGSQQLYVMDADGGNVRRLSFGPGRFATPVFSPRGDWIAFTCIAAGSFYIGVMRPDGTGLRMLAKGYMVEGPTWAPNGRVIMFTHQERSGKTLLYSVDVTGYNESRVPTPENASDAAWSPLIQSAKIE